MKIPRDMYILNNYIYIIDKLYDNLFYNKDIVDDYIFMFIKDLHKYPYIKDVYTSTIRSGNQEISFYKDNKKESFYTKDYTISITSTSNLDIYIEYHNKEIFNWSNGKIKTLDRKIDDIWYFFTNVYIINKILLFDYHNLKHSEYYIPSFSLLDYPPIPNLYTFILKKYIEETGDININNFIYDIFSNNKHLSKSLSRNIQLIKIFPESFIDTLKVSKLDKDAKLYIYLLKKFKFFYNKKTSLDIFNKYINRITEREDVIESFIEGMSFKIKDNYVLNSNYYRYRYIDRFTSNYNSTYYYNKDLNIPSIEEATKRVPITKLNDDKLKNIQFLKRCIDR